MKQVKTCSSCNKTLSLSFFSYHPSGLYKTASICKQCKNAKNRARYRDRNPEVKITRNKQEQALKREKYRIKYYIEHADKIREYHREYDRKRYAKRYSDPKVRIRQSIGTRIRRSFETGEYGSLESTLGYSLKDLKEHLEKQFQEGMSWENYGEWHIDHIIPISLFGFTSVSDIDFKMRWSLKNLQPLWATDNLKKGAK